MSQELRKLIEGIGIALAISSPGLLKFLILKQP
jgi:hypothetical protein